MVKPCENCGGTEIERRQGPGEWIEEPCPDCTSHPAEQKLDTLLAGLKAEVERLRRIQMHEEGMRGQWEREAPLQDDQAWAAQQVAGASKEAADRLENLLRANPEKWAAHVAVELALRRGALVRPDHCPECGRSGVIHAHHHDYDKPLDIEWLCPTCHKARHSAEVDPCA